MAIFIPEIPTVGVGQATEPMIDPYTPPRRESSSGSGMLQLARSLEGLSGSVDRAQDAKDKQDLANINIYSLRLKEGLTQLGGKPPTTADVNNILSDTGYVVRSRAATDKGIEDGIAIRGDIFGKIPAGLMPEEAEVQYDAAISSYMSSLGDVDPSYKNGVLQSLNAARKTRANVDYKVRVKNIQDGADAAIGSRVTDFLDNAMSGVDAGEFDDAIAPKPYVPGPGSSLGNGKGGFKFAHPDQTDVLPDVLDRVSAASGIFGSELTIQSGHRTAAYNAKVDGAKNSLHVKKKAVDISTAGMSDEQKTALTASLVQAGFTRIIGYSNEQAIHVDMGNPGADGLAVMWNKSSKNMGSAAPWFTAGVAAGKAGEKVAITGGQSAQYASASSATVTDVPPDVDYGDDPAPEDGDPAISPDVDDDGYPVDENAYQSDAETFTIGANLPRDENGEFIYSKNPKLNAAVIQIRNQIRTLQKEYERTYDGDKARQRDVIARRLIEFADKTNQPAVLHAIDFGILPKGLKAEFKATQKAITTRVNFIKKEQEKADKAAQDKKIWDARSEMDEFILSKRTPTEDDIRKWGAIDKGLVLEFKTRREAIDANLVDPKQQSALLESKKKEIRYAIDIGQDPSIVNLDGLISGSHRAEAVKFVDDYVKTGGEINDKYYEDRWNDAVASYYSSASIQGMSKVPVNPKIQDSFEDHLMEEVVNWRLNNPGKTLYRKGDRQEIFTKALAKVLVEHPAQNPEGAPNGSMPPVEKSTNTFDPNNEWGFAQ